VVAGAINYLDARRTGAAMTRVEAGDLLDLRRDIRDAGSIAPPVLDRLLEDATRRGARYIAVVAPEGVLASAGTPASDVRWQPPGPEERNQPGAPPPESRPRREGDPPRGDRPPPPPRPGEPPGARQGPDDSPPSPRDDVPRAEARPGEPEQTPPLQRIPGTPLFRAVGWLEPPADPRRPPTPGDRRGPLAPERATFVVDFEPVVAARLVSRALVTLVAQVTTSSVLFVAAVGFWRQSRRAQAAREEAERDRHLRTLGEMSAVLGHELRNPLASLKGHAQLLLERLPSEHPGHGAADTIVRESVRLEALANQVLEFVKTGTLNLRSDDPRAIATEAIEASGLDGVTLTAAETLPAWPLDRDRLVPVLVNLLKNARDASPAGAGIEIRVAVDGGRLLFDVLDRGEGLPPGEEARAFEPFFTKRVHGTGLGLALAKRVVDGHGGTIRADNRPGGGAVFRIALPRNPPPRAT
jgi:two-component system sensor histidine kinase HydH